MTSAAPARKPYRKAPPQHRETRHTVPVFREDVSGSALPSANPAPSAQPDHCQVIFPRNHAPILQRTRFTGPYPQCHERPVWSQASDSELDVSSLSSLELSVLPPPRIFSHGSFGVKLPPKPHRHQKMNRYTSCSDDLLVFSADDDLASSEGSQQCIPGSSPSHSTRSVEHFLVFKEKAQILAPKEEQRPPHAAPLLHAHPPKGILKQSHQLGLYTSDSLRKSKSAEILAQERSRGRSKKPKSMSLDREKGVRASPTGRATSTSSISPSSMPPEWKMQRLEEKVKFSKFLDEITYRVLSPASIKMLCGKLPEPAVSSKGSQIKLHNNPQKYEFKDHHDKKQERSGLWDKWATQHSRDSRKSGEARPKAWHNSEDSPEGQMSEKQHTDPHREGARPKTEGPIYSQVGGSDDSEWDDRTPRGVQHQPQPHQLPHIESRPVQKDNTDKSGLPKAKIPIIRVECENTPLSQVTPFSILSQIKVCLWQHFWLFPFLMYNPLLHWGNYTKCHAFKTIVPEYSWNILSEFN